MYTWIVDERLSTRAICSRLTKNQTPTPGGAAVWQPTTVGRILRNPVYKGIFFYQKAESVTPSRRMNNDPYRKARKTGKRLRPPEDWITIPVVPIIDEDLWERAQRQLEQNSRLSRRNNKRHEYLLHSLITCTECGSTYSGQVQNERKYYRCTNKHSVKALEGSRCSSRAIRADSIEQPIWAAITDALSRPQVLVAEYERRSKEAHNQDAIEVERKQVQLARKRIKGQEDRVTDAYVGEAMDLDRYKAEMSKLGTKGKELDRAMKELERPKDRGSHAGRRFVTSNASVPE